MDFQNCPDKILTVTGIYDYITKKFPYYGITNKQNQNWRGAIRHCLSLEDCFLKLPRKNGKGHYWAFDPINSATCSIDKRGKGIRNRSRAHIRHYSVWFDDPRFTQEKAAVDFILLLSASASNHRLRNGHPRLACFIWNISKAYCVESFSFTARFRPQKEYSPVFSSNCAFYSKKISGNSNVCIPLGLE